MTSVLTILRSILSCCIFFSSASFFILASSISRCFLSAYTTCPRHTQQFFKYCVINYMTLKNYARRFTLFLLVKFHSFFSVYRRYRGTVIIYSNISLQNKANLQTIYNIFIKTNIYYNELKTTQHGFNIFIIIIVCLIYTCSTFNIKNMCK